MNRNLLPEPEDADVFVEMGQWGSVHDGRTIGTSGLGPCLGLGIFDPASSMAYIAHTMATDHTVAHEMADEAIRNTADVGRIAVWVSGAASGQMYIDQAPTINRRIESEVLNWLQAVGISSANITMLLVPDSATSASIVIDASSGQGQITLDDYSEFLSSPY